MNNPAFKNFNITTIKKRKNQNLVELMNDRFCLMSVHFSPNILKEKLLEHNLDY
jgi:hypothetical protein